MGYAPHEFAGFGIPRSRRVSLTEECLDILRLAWSGERFSYTGKRWSFSDVRVTPDPVQPGGPPLWLASASLASAQRAARFNTHLLPQGSREHVLDPWRAAVTAAGRDPDSYRIGIIHGVFVTDDEERDWPQIGVAEKYRRDVYAGLIRAAADNQRPAERTERTNAPRVPIPLSPLQWTVGNVAHCVAELTAFMGEHGVTDLVTWGGPPGLPPSVMNASLERFAREVIPQVKANLQ